MRIYESSMVDEDEVVVGKEAYCISLVRQRRGGR